jgi:hypothetical protein
MDCAELVYCNAKKKEGRSVSMTWHNRYGWTTHSQKVLLTKMVREIGIGLN